MKVSVLLISYNGDRFIKPQIESILNEISDEDELIISDDGSTDNTIDIIQSFSQKHPNVKLVVGPHNGIASNFSNAYHYSDGDLIFFSDQDDEWLPGKVNAVKEHFDAHSEHKVVMHNAYMCDGENNIVNEEANIFRLRSAGHGVIRNIVKSTYYGCCMAFRREFLEKYMPLAPETIAYDQFLGLCAEKSHCVGFIPEKYLKHRVHSNNQSQEQPLLKIIRLRKIKIMQFFKYKNGMK